VKLLATLLEENSRVPAILAQLDLIQTIQSDEWWQDVTPQMIEHVRRKLRSLMQLIEKKKRKPVYSDFKDELGEGEEVQLAELTTAADFERFREKARHFLRQHEDHIAIHKLRTNEPLTKLDLEELERMLAESGVASHADLEKAKKESAGLGLFVRSLVGLDSEAAKKVLGEFLSHKTLGAHQIEFINLIVDHLTEQGVMDAALLYESPFIDANPLGVDGVFDAGEVTQIIEALELVKQRAVA
jgi:type I restriction enzyme R subunit